MDIALDQTNQTPAQSTDPLELEDITPGTIHSSITQNDERAETNVHNTPSSVHPIPLPENGQASLHTTMPSAEPSGYPVSIKSSARVIMAQVKFIEEENRHLEAQRQVQTNPMSSHHTDIDSWPEPSAHGRKRVLVGSRLAHKPDRTGELESTADTHLQHLMRFPARILLKNSTEIS